MKRATPSGPEVDGIEARAYTIPTDRPESDGTLQWTSTTLVVVLASAGDVTGVGYGYSHPAAVDLVTGLFGPEVRGRSAMAPEEAWEAMRHRARNLLRPGLVGMAMAAVDTALWDLKARLLDLPLITLLGPLRDEVPVYGSGGFTSYSETELREQLGSWAARGMDMVKMKVGRDPDDDPARVRAAREAVGEDVKLFVDANGAWSRKQALAASTRMHSESDISWVEEPVSSDDLEGLRLLRDRVPGGVDVAAGEYGTDVFYFRRMLDAGSVDVLQVDATRCGGFTPFLRVAALCEARDLPLSAHTAPTLHAAVCCAAPRAVHVEWFHDHVRIEAMAFDGGPTLEAGRLRPDPDAPGMGLTLKEADLAEYRVGSS